MVWIETDYRALAHAGQEGLPLRLSNGVVVIGNFDGVHLGHQALLAQARRLADSAGSYGADTPLLVLTFTPHPRRFFQNDLPPFLLADPVLRRQFLLETGANAIVEMTFDGILARASADDFITMILQGALCAKHIVVGADFRFGTNRTGDVTLLQQKFAVTAPDLVCDVMGLPITSGRVREALKKGHTHSAAELLGRPWQTRGVVLRGDQRGRTIGFPTANLVLDHFITPQFGVYAARVQIEGQEQEQWHDAVMNFGQRPTFQLAQPLLEVHLLDFTGDLYGKTLRVAWMDYLRPELKFTGLDSLKAQLTEDATRARQLLAKAL